MATVLVVDDAQDVAALLARLLRRWGHIALCATCGMDAIQVARAFALDLVILDYMMPDLNGLDVLHAIRAGEGTAHARVVMFSAVSDTAVVDRALAGGADGYWIKATFDYTQFEERVAAELARGPHVGA